jgi:hypothetical protein
MYPITQANRRIPHLSTAANMISRPSTKSTLCRGCRHPLALPVKTIRYTSAWQLHLLKRKVSVRRPWANSGRHTRGVAGHPPNGQAVSIRTTAPIDIRRVDTMASDLAARCPNDGLSPDLVSCAFNWLSRNRVYFLTVKRLGRLCCWMRFRKAASSSVALSAVSRMVSR